MAKKPTYEQLKRRVRELEKKAAECKQVEKEMKRFRAAVEQSIDGIAIGDLSPKLVYVNDAYAQMHGYSPEEMIGMKASDLHNKEQTDAFNKGIRQIRTRGVWIGEIGHIRKDGTAFPASMSVTLLKDDDGKPAWVVAVARDVTEVKRREEELKFREEFSSRLLNNSPNPIIGINPDTSISYVNPALERLTGFSSKELIGMKAPYPFWRKGMVKNIQKDLKAAMRKGAKAVEEPFQKKNGEPFWVDITSLPIIHKGKVDYYLANWVDITERKLCQRALKESEEKYRLLIESSGAAITFFDKSGTYLFLNHLAAKWLHGKPEDYIGKTVYDTFPKGWADKSAKRFRRIFKSGVGETIEEKVKPLDRWISANLQPVRNQDGKIIGVQVVTYDISDRKQAEEALRRREAALATRTGELEEVNSALRVLMNRTKEDKKELEENVSSNIKGLVAPYAEKLRKSGLGAKQMAYLNMLESNLNDITSPFTRELSSKYSRFTPAEIQIAHLVKDGKTTKQIAKLLNLSFRTIESHRQNIRMKIGAKSKKANLRSLLLSMRDD
jgi:PAS domain S-box-containing protein